MARQVRKAQDHAGRLAPLTDRFPAFDVAAGYQVAARVHAHRLAAGAVPRGRKMGFNNAAIWPEYGVHQPIWGLVYEHTLHQADGQRVRIALSLAAEPKIEPEIAFGLAGWQPLQVAFD